MKTKTIIFATMMSLALGLFVACSSDEDSDEVLLNNEKLIRSDFKESAIIPSKTIPATIKARMDSVELDVFSKLSTIGYVDYSFFDTKYYAENKQEILESLTRAYNKYVAEGENNIYFSIYTPEKTKDNFRAMRITPIEVGSGAAFCESITFASFSYGFNVFLAVGNNDYSVNYFYLNQGIPADYTPLDDITPASVTVSGLEGTLRINNASYLNITDSTLLNVTASKSVSLTFPPQSEF